MIPFYINLYTCNEKLLLNLKYSYFHVYVFFSLQLKKNISPKNTFCDLTCITI